MPVGANILKESGLPLFFEVTNPEQVGIQPLENWMGDSLRT